MLILLGILAAVVVYYLWKQHTAKQSEKIVGKSEPEQKTKEEIPAFQMEPYEKKGGFNNDPNLPTVLDGVDYLYQDKYADLFETLRNGDFDQLLKDCTQRIEQSPEEGELYILRAFANRKRVSSLSLTKAIDDDLTKALEFRPDDIRVLRGRCELTATKTKCKRHIGDMARLMELDPENYDQYLLSQAYYYKWTGDYEHAKENLQVLIDKRSPKASEASWLMSEFNVTTPNS